ncbi:cytochrome c [Thermomonas sp. HDW16]|uniref:cytochrome c n=1 Tax=Thermomonas sp. HDW16 TaxID=2714945 RepID=UPI0014095563|nr:cytochrome c [Thermomonas sp. HDW16]QIL20473.1 cytochrome c [Thermomonas sp. HDW16]
MSNVDPNRRPSNFGRYLFLLILGLVLGAVATVMALRAIQARKDHFPESLMHVQQWHMGQLKTDMEQHHCNATDVLPHLQALRMTSNDLEAAFPDLRDDQRFTTASTAMRAAMDKSVSNPPLTCEGLGATIKEIGETCKGCHQDFRN